MKRITTNEVLRLLDDMNLSYCEYGQVRDKGEYKGEYYTLCEQISKETAAEMERRAKNRIRVIISACEYAPEIKHFAIFVKSQKYLNYENKASDIKGIR